MTSAVLAAAAAILGVAIGRFWDTRSEAVRWRRDQKAVSYQRYAEQFQTMYEAIRVVTLMELTAQNLQVEADRVRVDNFPAWVGALSAVWLHGSPGVVAAAMMLDQAQTDLFYGVSCGMFSTPQDWDHAQLLARQAFEQFIGAARNELGLAPAHGRFFSKPRLIPPPTASNDS